MRAVVAEHFGGPEVLELKEIERPHAGPGEILVRVRASATNPVEAKLRQNGEAAGMKAPMFPGYDGAGIVVGLGPGVTEFSEGDRVFYTPEIVGGSGSHAEYQAVPAYLAAPMPRGLSYEEASAVPLAGGTAWEAVIRRLALRPGETILIHAGAGGVGSFAVQFARAAGARVIATAGPDHQDTLRDLGADVAVDYHAEDAAEVALRETNGQGVEAAFDIYGNDLVSRCVPAMRSFGRIACILAPESPLDPAFYRKNLTLHGVLLTRERRRLLEMTPLLERGLVKPLVDEVLPLSEVREAHRRLDSGHGRGKIVLEVSQD